MRLLLFLPVAVTLLGGCKNSCQQVCVRMAKYAESECNLVVPSDQLSTCIEQQDGAASKDHRETCRDFGDIDAIANEWSCAQLEVYWGAGDGGGDGSEEKTTE